MNIGVSTIVRNSLTKTECAIRRVPEAYRKELCENLEEMLNKPMGYVFRHTNSIAIDCFHTVSELHHNLSDADKEVFKKQFSELVKQFGIKRRISQ